MQIVSITRFAGCGVAEKMDNFWRSGKFIIVRRPLTRVKMCKFQRYTTKDKCCAGSS